MAKRTRRGKTRGMALAVPRGNCSSMQRRQAQCKFDGAQRLRYTAPEADWPAYRGPVTVRYVALDGTITVTQHSAE